MPRDRRRTARARPRLESLEGRTLMAATGPSDNPFSFKLPTYDFFSQQSNAAVVTLVRSGAGSTVADVTTESAGPTDATAVPGVNYVPIHQTVAFRPGQRSVPITIPIIPGGPNPGGLIVNLYVKPDGAEDSADKIARIVLANQVDVTQPKVIGARLITKKSAATGIALTFDKPMSPKFVQEAANYSVRELSLQGLGGFVTLLTSAFRNTSPTNPSPSVGPIPVLSATYNASNHTVLLKIVPANSSARFEVTGIYSGRQASPTPPSDVTGNPLKSFKIVVDKKSSPPRSPGTSTPPARRAKPRA